MLIYPGEDLSGGHLKSTYGPLYYFENHSYTGFQTILKFFLFNVTFLTKLTKYLRKLIPYLQIQGT